ncbi:MAG: outer membrane beta-barrel protein [Betaproteobacteria bacterium]|nr:outer membrane beta-barrel protein [Betaproteobacteria bacterium]
MRKHIIAAAIAALSLSGVAVAHEAGEVILRVGVAHADPDVSSSKVKLNGRSVSGTGVDVGSDTQLGLTTTLMIMPHFGIELLAATPFTHKLTLTQKGYSDFKLGKVSQLPPTVSAQFFFLNPKSRFQPYVGLGVTYTAFYNEKLSNEAKAAGFSDLSLKNSLGLTGQLGMDYALGDSLFLNAAVWRMGMSTTAKMKGLLGDYKVDVDVDPWVYFIGVGFKF